MRIIAFISEALAVRDILAHLVGATSPPRIPQFLREFAPV
jgi:hypothetical protein